MTIFSRNEDGRTHESLCRGCCSFCCVGVVIRGLRHGAAGLEQSLHLKPESREPAELGDPDTATFASREPAGDEFHAVILFYKAKAARLKAAKPKVVYAFIGVAYQQVLAIALARLGERRLTEQDRSQYRR